MPRDFYPRKLEDIMQQWKEEHNAPAVLLKLAAEWAVKNNLFQGKPISVEEQCEREMRRVLQQQRYTDPQGRNPRTKLAVKIEYEGRQQTLWVDVRYDKPVLIETAFEQNHKRIENDVKRESMEVQSFNDNNKFGYQMKLFDYNLNPIANDARSSGVYDDTYDDGEFDAGE